MYGSHSHLNVLLRIGIGKVISKVFPFFPQKFLQKMNTYHNTLIFLSVINYKTMKFVSKILSLENTIKSYLLLWLYFEITWEKMCFTLHYISLTFEVDISILWQHFKSVASWCIAFSGKSIFPKNSLKAKKNQGSVVQSCWDSMLTSWNTFLKCNIIPGNVFYWSKRTNFNLTSI